MSTKYVTDIHIPSEAVLKEYDKLIDKNYGFKDVLIRSGRYAIVLGTFIDNIKMNSNGFKAVYRDCKNFINTFSKYALRDFTGESFAYGRVLTTILRIKSALLMYIFLKRR